MVEERALHGKGGEIAGDHRRICVDRLGLGDVERGGRQTSSPRQRIGLVEALANRLPLPIGGEKHAGNGGSLSAEEAAEPREIGPVIGLETDLPATAIQTVDGFLGQKHSTASPTECTRTASRASIGRSYLLA